MSENQGKRWLRGLVLATALLAAAGLPAPTATLEARTRCGTEIFYYSDPSLTTIVGANIWLPEACGCAYFHWGTLTPYRVVQDSTC